MKNNDNGDFHSAHETINQKNIQERLAAATSTTEALTKLNVTIDALPQKWQKQLQQVASAKAALDIELDPIAVSLHQSCLISQQMNDEYTLLMLTQKDAELQAKIDRNNKALEELRKELECSKSLLMLRSPNPETVLEAIRQWKQKVTLYEESYEKAQAKYSKLPVPESIMPKSIQSLVETLAKLRAKAAELQERAEDVQLARQARHTLTMLMR